MMISNLSNKYLQDSIHSKYRIISKYKKNELILYQNQINKNFNILNHYNMNIYLNQLILYDNISDIQFHIDIQQIINEININCKYRKGPTN